MLYQRRQRFERLLRLRQREVDKKRAALAQANEAMRVTRLALEEAQTALRDAARLYRLPAGQSRSAEAFMEAGQWLRDRVKLVERALVAQEHMKEKVRIAETGVKEAEREKRKVETLLQRIAEEERLEQNRREQIEQDEMASRMGSLDSYSNN